MSLCPGRRIGPYEIVARLVAGALAEAYRASDPRLEDGVALMVLTADVVTDPERLARFSREDKLLASLSHPNIANIGGGRPSRRALMAVAIDPNQDPPVETCTPLLDIEPDWLRFGGMLYDVAADSTRFLMARETPGAGSRPTRMVLVQNWEAEFTQEGRR